MDMHRPVNWNQKRLSKRVGKRGLVKLAEKEDESIMATHHQTGRLLDCLCFTVYTGNSGSM